MLQSQSAEGVALPVREPGAEGRQTKAMATHLASQGAASAMVVATCVCVSSGVWTARDSMRPVTFLSPRPVSVPVRKSVERSQAVGNHKQWTGCRREARSLFYLMDLFVVDKSTNRRIDELTNKSTDRQMDKRSKSTKLLDLSTTSCG